MTYKLGVPLTSSGGEACMWSWSMGLPNLPNHLLNQCSLTMIWTWLLLLGTFTYIKACTHRHPLGVFRHFKEAFIRRSPRNPCLESKDPMALPRRPFQCNPTKFTFSEICQDAECCLMSVSIEQLECELLNKSAIQNINTDQVDLSTKGNENIR